MIKLLVLDVDGCMTDGKIVYDANGIESKSFNVKDGLAIATWIRMGNDVAIITGRKSTIVEKRAKELGIVHLFQGVKDKQKVLEKLLYTLQIKLSEVAAIGDDLNDYHMLQSVAKSFTPNNGVKEIREIVDIVLQAKGGEGAIREMIDSIVEQNNQKEAFLAHWL